MREQIKRLANKDDALQFVRYLAVGVVNTFTGYGIIFGCMYLLGIDPIASNAIGYGVGVIVSYTINKRFTFKSKANDRATFFRFLLVTGLAYLANLFTLLVSIHVFGVHQGVAQVIAGAVYVLTAFVGSKFYAFAVATTLEPNAKKAHESPAN